MNDLMTQTEEQIINDLLADMTYWWLRVFIKQRTAWAELPSSSIGTA